ncbi:MAG TPA: alpha/beta hydrolase [Vicinamibacterales bacterium]
MRRFQAIPFLILFGCTLLAQARPSLDLANEAVRDGIRLSYGPAALQFGELRLPAGPGPFPVAIVVHGGCWLAKFPNMDARAVSMEYMRPLAVALTDAGVATWNVEYRRLGDEGGGWPGTFQDVARAADHVRVMAHDRPLDLSRVVAVGHSAGGHFAMWLGGRKNLSSSSELYTRDPLKLRGVVNLDGPTDLKATIAVQRSICVSPVITDLIGGTPDERPSRYHDGSPIELLPIGVSQYVFAGSMFASQARPYETAAQKHGETVTTTVLPDAGHFVFVDPRSPDWPQVLEAVRRLASFAGRQ